MSRKKPCFVCEGCKKCDHGAGIVMAYNIANPVGKIIEFVFMKNAKQAVGRCVAKKKGSLIIFLTHIKNKNEAYTIPKKDTKMSIGSGTLVVGCI